jgi:NAD(P)-dependent dehydrogenase (short-subunit alcohol dehydrogenase family)
MMDVDQIDLGGQVALVTGGSRGIGREIALHLARSGASVAVTARDRAKLEAVAAEIEESGGRCLAVEMEVTDRKSVENGIREIETSLGPVDLLVNNAGVSGTAVNFWEADPDEWWQVVEVNLSGAMLCSRFVLPGMVGRGCGRIINMGSNLGIRPFPGVSAYAASKAALIRLSDALAEELKDHGICVFAVSPGLVLTDMTREVKERNIFPDSEWTPIERIAELCLSLAGGKADVLTGRYIHAGSDKLEDLVRNAKTIREEDLYAMRLRT